jgi:NitT/TauT family transport system substrate-binding protein
MIKKENPEMTDEQLAYSVAKMKEYGIAVSGDAVDKGIGCMTDARWKEYFDMGVGIGMFTEGADYTTAYTTEFVCKGVGVDLVK